MYWDAKNLLQIIPFYNTFIEKPEIRKLSNVQLLKKLLFYDELSIVKIIVYLVDMQKVVKLKLLLKGILKV